MCSFSVHWHVIHDDLLVWHYDLLFRFDLDLYWKTSLRSGDYACRIYSGKITINEIQFIAQGHCGPNCFDLNTGKMFPNMMTFGSNGTRTDSHNGLLYNYWLGFEPRNSTLKSKVFSDRGRQAYLIPWRDGISCPSWGVWDILIVGFQQGSVSWLLYIAIK